MSEPKAKTTEADPPLDAARKWCPKCGKGAIFPDTHYCAVCNTKVYYDRLPDGPPSDAAELLPLNQRERDLLRYCRCELHQAGLVTDEEYTEMLNWGSNGPGGGSPSARRLEDYDQLRASLAQSKAQVDGLRQRMTELVALVRQVEHNTKAIPTDEPGIRAMLDGFCLSLDGIADLIDAALAQPRP